MSNLSEVRFPDTITFTEPSTQHPNSANKSIADVARDLEGKYAILKMFSRKNAKEIKSIIVSEIKKSWQHDRSQTITNIAISERIKNRFRKYIINNETGIKTKASVVRGNQSFVDTSAYYRSMGVRIN